LRCTHGISEEAFTEAVLRIEKEELKPLGISLCGSNTLDDWTVFILRIEGEECSTFEFLPKTGEFRKSGSGPISCGTC
jgi:hypothetical protein